MALRGSSKMLARKIQTEANAANIEDVTQLPSGDINSLYVAKTRSSSQSGSNFGWGAQLDLGAQLM